MLERILTLVFRCTGVSFTGTGVGESIYSTVDSCNSTIPVTGAPGRSDEDISRRCHPRCPVGRAPVGEGVEGGVAVGGGDGEGRGGGGTLVSRRREREACYSKEWTCVTSPAILRAPE